MASLEHNPRPSQSSIEAFWKGLEEVALKQLCQVTLGLPSS